MAKQMIWNNQGYFEFLEENELFEQNHIFTKNRNSSTSVKTAPIPTITYFGKRPNDEKNKKLRNYSKCPYCNVKCIKIAKHIKKVHKDKIEIKVNVENKTQNTPKKKKNLKQSKLNIVQFTKYLKSCSKTKIKKLLYLRWSETASEISFLEYVGKHNILFTDSFDETSIEVKMLYNFYTTNRNIVKNVSLQKDSNSKNIKTKKINFKDKSKNNDNVYYYPISGSFDSKVYGKNSSYLNKGDHNFREEGKFGSSVLSDDYDN